MVCNKVIVPNKVIFSYFDFSHQNQIIPENVCILKVTVREPLVKREEKE